MEGSRPVGGVARSSYSVARALCARQPGPDLQSGQHDTALHPEPVADEKLDGVISAEIVPRLMLLHKPTEPESPRTSFPQSAELAARVPDFTTLVLQHEVDVIEAYLRVLVKRGFSLEELLLNLLAPAARRLGTMWENDLVDFVEVTVGTSRLQQLVHHLTYPTKKVEIEPQRRLLLLPAPDEQHAFGLVMVSHLFQRNGWQVEGVSPMEPDEIYALVARKHFNLIGFSLSCERLIDKLSSTIHSVRRFSKNDSAQVMVGGRIFAQDAALRPDVGADFVANDAQEALGLAQQAFNRDACGRDS